MSRRYEAAPIVEAICEFQFEPGPPWDLAIPGLIYEQLKDVFPLRKQIAQIGTVIVGNISPTQFGAIPLIQFLNENKNTLVQVGQNLLTVNQLYPYTSWEEFQPQIGQGLQAYVTVAKPKRVDTVTLRYINRITFRHAIELEDYFNIRPVLDHTFSGDFRSFIVGIQLPVKNTQNTINIQLGTIEVDEPDAMTIVLDIHYVLSHLESFEFGAVLAEIDTGHTKVEEIFEACITDRLRQKFKEVEK